MPNARRNRADLERQIARLKMQVVYWQGRVAELEAKLGVTLPVLSLDYDGRPIRFFSLQGRPFVLGRDVLEQLPRAPQPYPQIKGPQTAAIFRRIGLGAREMSGLNASDIARVWGTTERHLCAALGISTKVRWIGSVTHLGIEALKPHAPEFCAWVEREAFPAVIERFRKVAAS